MRISLVLSIVSAPRFFIFSHLILGLFGPNYVTASTAMGILGFSTYPYAIKSHYVAIARGSGKYATSSAPNHVWRHLGSWACGSRWRATRSDRRGDRYFLALSLEAVVYAPTAFGVLRSPPESEKGGPGTGKDRGEVGELKAKPELTKEDPNNRPQTGKRIDPR